jgi:hypothetical protein
VNRRRDRVLLPGWWRVWESGPQWSGTARRRIGIPDPAPPAERDDWHFWEAEMQSRSTAKPIAHEQNSPDRSMNEGNA